MANILHIQYPVGQGGLHLGIIGNTAYIYDCGCLHGSKANIKNIFRDIQKRLNNCNALNIYISHLHTDHYNLLKTLDKYISSSIKTQLFLPQITTVDKIQLLFTDPSLKDTTNDYNEIYNTISENRIEYLTNIKEQITLYSQSIETYIRKIYEKFILLPYVIGIDSTEIESFVNMLAQDKNTPEKLWSILKEPKEFLKFKQLFEKKFPGKISSHGGENNVMLCLYCGADMCESHWCSFIDRSFFNPCGFNIYGAWLHTGDAGLTINQNLQDFYGYYKYVIPNVSFVQIPHHGSKNNHDMWFSKIFNHMGLNTIFYFTTQKTGTTKNKLTDLRLLKQQLYKVTDVSTTGIQIKGQII